MIPGRGVCAVVKGKTVLAGNPELLHEHGVALGSVPSAKRTFSRAARLPMWQQMACLSASLLCPIRCAKKVQTP